MLKYNELFPIEFNKHIPVTLPGGVNQHGKSCIRDWLADWIYNNTHFFATDARIISHSILTDDFFIQREGMPRITRRLSKELIDREQIKITNAALTEFGNLVNNYTVTATEAFVMFTDHMEGSAEYYCNGRSCWWTDFWRSRDWLVYNGGGALLAFDADNLEKPVGRILHTPSPNGNMLLFNAYGNIGLPIAWAELVSKMFAGTKASVIEWNERNSEAYFNTPHNTGYVNAEGRPAQNLGAFWMKPLTYKYELWKTCGYCNQRVPESQLSNGMCDACRANLDECETCHRHVERGSLLEIQGLHVCQNCYDNNYRTCSECGAVDHRSNMTWVYARSTWFCNQHVPEKRQYGQFRALYGGGTRDDFNIVNRYTIAPVGFSQPQGNLSAQEREAAIQRLREILSR